MASSRSTDPMMKVPAGIVTKDIPEAETRTFPGGGGDEDGE